jgi:uncharacterized protein (DUF1501 family)
MSDSSCCDEYEQAAGTTRRRFLGGIAAGAGLGVVSTAFGGVFRQVVYANTTGNNVVVVISLRGGIDGLSVVVPYAESSYAALRPGIGIAPSALICTDGTFGLHPQLAPLRQLWTDNRLAAVQAVGMSVPNRSHFSAMEQVEDADPGSAVRQGWINRAIGLNTDAFPSEAVQFGTSIVPTALTGAAPVLATPSIKQLYLAAANPEWDDEGWMTRRRAQLHTVWDPAGGGLGSAGRSALQVVAQLSPFASETYEPQNGASYPSEGDAADLSDALQNSAQLIRADVGTEMIALDYGSWDMHVDLGTADSGQMASMLEGFATALSAFLQDLGTVADRVTVVTISEFGRRVEENGAGGLDHGWGNMMLLAGAGVKGGQYYGSWPGLDHLTDGDLSVTTDYRNVLGEIVETRLGASVGAVFPGLSYQRLNVMSP